MSINDLPIEILTKILDSVFLHKYTVFVHEYSGLNSASYVGNLTKCLSSECKNQKRCDLLGTLEARQLKNIISTCKLWYIIIQDHKYNIWARSNDSIILRRAYTLNFFQKDDLIVFT
jgi:hypothetical protein